MGVRIQKIPVPARNPRKASDFRDYCRALAQIEVGESFLYAMTSAHRLAITTLQHALGRRFAARRDGEGETFRIGRIE